MDVAYYISELLGQLGEINVPGLGYFVQSRLNGYYNEDEDTFHPPHHKVGFEPQYIEDDVLIQYIAEKKKISLASSKYFTQKYIDNLKKEAMLKDFPLADLGWIFINQTKIIFTPAAVQANDPAFYGYQPIKINKLNDLSVDDLLHSMEDEQALSALHQPITEPLSETPPLEDPQPLAEQETITEHKSAEPVQINEPTAVHPEVITPTEQADGEEDIILMGRNYLGDEEQTGNWGRTWLIVLLVIVALALAIFGLYKYNPSLFNRLLGNKSAVAALSTNATQKAASPEATDTSKEAAIAKNDTSTDAKTTAAPLNDQPVANDTLARKRYEILGGAFHTIKEANKTIDNYKRMGFDAHILKNVPGRLYKITLGTYFNIDEAINAENKLLKTGHVTTKQIGIQPYNPKINQKR